MQSKFISVGLTEGDTKQLERIRKERQQRPRRSERETEMDELRAEGKEINYASLEGKGIFFND